MPSFEVLIAFTLAALLMNLSPGPSNLYVMARSISHGFAGGAVAALGLAAGSLVHVLATTLGISALFVYSPTAYTLVKLLGAAYLIYLGVRYYLSPAVDAIKNLALKQKTLAKIFFESIVVEVSNPKTALFFIAFLPQFVNTNAAISPQLLVLGLIVTVSAMPCDLLVAAASHKMGGWIANSSRAQKLQNKISGSLLIGLGAFVAINEAETILQK